MTVRRRPKFESLSFWNQPSAEGQGAKIFFPAMGKPTGSEFLHEIWEYQTSKQFAIHRNLIVNQVVFQKTKVVPVRDENLEYLHRKR